ncbi:MAG: flagellar hook protein FlgE [Chromatiales bacterium]|nr:flagellar hook protein FlgE [Chromatiales bacterium]
MAFQTSLSGLTAAQGNLSITGNNIANASTNGFKKSRAEFADVYATSFGSSGSNTIGSGVRLASVTQQFTQGNIEFTESSLDLALSGQGFFVLHDTDGSEMFSRAGAFQVDRDGYIVNTHGQRLQGYDVDQATGLVSNLTTNDIQLTTGTNPARATDALRTDGTPGGVDISMNLDADAPVLGAGNVMAGSGTFSPLDPSTYSFSTSTTVYDSLGGDHTATFYYVHTDMASREWEVYAEIENTVGDRFLSGPQTYNFDASGNIINPAGATPGIAIFFDGALPIYQSTDSWATWAGAAAFDPGNGALPFNDLRVDQSLTTQFAGSSTVNSLVQSGYPTGELSGIDIDETGVVFARYTNGQSYMLAAVAVANFANPQGLSPVGDTNWVQTYSAGDVIYGQAGRGIFGKIQSAALESSNVDISKQLVNMILAQRDFQANAKMISTEDQITQTIINIR